MSITVFLNSQKWNFSGMNDQFQQLPLEQCREIVAKLRQLTTESEIRNNLLLLLDQQPFLNLDWSRGSIFWRGRKSENINGYSNISELSYPPSRFATVGRLNAPGESMLYLSSRKFTVFTEIHAEPGDCIHLVGYKIRKNKSARIGLIGDLFHVYRTGFSMLNSVVGEAIDEILNASDYDLAKSIVYVDAYLSSVLRNPSATSQRYLYTKTLGKLLFNKVDEVKSLFYPSVVQEGGMNLAMSPTVADDVLEPVSSSIVLIQDKLEFGMYESIHIKNCVDVRDSGDFVWESAKHPRGFILFEKS